MDRVMNSPANRYARRDARTRETRLAEAKKLMGDAVADYERRCEAYEGEIAALNAKIAALEAIQGPATASAQNANTSKSKKPRGATAASRAHPGGAK